MTNPATQLQHVVLLNFPEPLSDADDAYLRSAVEGWSQTIGIATEARIGADLTGARSRGYDYLLFTVFPDLEALQAYTVHPVHQEFVAFLEAHDCERLGFDYYF